MTAENNESILQSIKKLLSIDSSYTEFDTDIIIHINTILSNLIQMGVGPEEGFSIEDDSSKWSDFIGNYSKVQQVKTYVYVKVRLLFDPPSNASMIEVLNKQANELEVRLYTETGGY